MKKLINDYKLTEYGTSAYLAVMFLAFPLCFHNSYIDIMETKTFFFVAATCLYLIAFVVLLWLESVFQAEKKRKLNVKSEKKAKPSTAAKKKGILYQDIFFIIFLAAVVISTLCSGDIIKAWYSTECKMFGTMILLLCCGVYFYVSAGYVINRAVKICLSAGIGIVFILAILNRYGIDPLNMQSILYEHQRPIYISTIGNVNILANFICIFLPLFMGAFLYAEKIPDKVISGLLVYTGVMAGIAANSDSFFLGFGAGLAVFMFTGFMKSIPLEIEEAAMIDGCNPFQTYFKIVLPILKPTMISVGILETMWVWNDYLLPYLVLDRKKYSTVPILIQYFKGSFGRVEMGPMMACIILTVLPIIIIYLICQKHIIKGVVAGAVKG